MWNSCKLLIISRIGFISDTLLGDHFGKGKGRPDVGLILAEVLVGRNALKRVKEGHVEFGLLGSGGEGLRDGESLAEMVDQGDDGVRLDGRERGEIREAAIGGSDILGGFGEGAPFGGEITGPPVELLRVRIVEDERAWIGDLDANGAFIVFPVGAGRSGDAEVVGPGSRGKTFVNEPVGFNDICGSDLERGTAPSVVGAAGRLAGCKVQDEKVFGELFGEELTGGEAELFTVDRESGGHGRGGRKASGE